MNKIKHIVKKWVFYLLGIGLLIYIYLSVGVANVYSELLTTNMYLVYIAMICAGAAVAIRVFKFRILLIGESFSAVLEIFTLSRIGKEVSFAGYFIPLLRKRNRSNGTFGNLVVDRFTEIFSTLLLAFASCLLVLQNGYLELIVLALITGCLVLMAFIPFLNAGRIRIKIANRYVAQVLESVDTIQERLRFNSNVILRIYGLSMLATMLDFFSAMFVFAAYNVEVSFFQVSIVWASSALISMILFMIIGSTEASVIYLYQHLFNISKVVTASTVIVSRVLSFVVLSLLFLLVIVSPRKTIQPVKQADA